MFHVFNAWEDTSFAASFSQLFGPCKIRRFPFIEIPNNVEVFHLVVATEDLDVPLKRYIFYRFELLVDFLLEQQISPLSASVQSRFAVNTENSFSAIRRIILEEYAEGDVRYNYELESGVYGLIQDPDRGPPVVRHALWVGK